MKFSMFAHPPTPACENFQQCEQREERKKEHMRTPRSRTSFPALSTMVVPETLRMPVDAIFIVLFKEMSLK